MQHQTNKQKRATQHCSKSSFSMHSRWI